MKFASSFLFLLMLISAVSSQTNKASLPIEEKFSSDARIEYTKQRVPRSYIVGKKNGVEYRYFHDDSRGVIEGAKNSGAELPLGQYDSKKWQFVCYIEDSGRQKRCGFYKEGIAIITYTNNQASGTWIGVTNFSLGDGKLGTYADVVQVDGVEVYNSRNKQFSTEALSLMRSGKVLTLRRGPDPEGVTTYELYGFNEALELSQWALKHIQ